MRHAVWKARLTRALLAIAALVAIAPASNLVAGAFQSASPAVGARTGMRANALVDVANPLTTLERAEELAQAGTAQLPEYFREEIGLPDGARDARVNEDGTVVGCTVDATPDAALQLVSARMGQGGWLKVDLGDGMGATFVKDGGFCTWALVTCTQTGRTTSIVYRCVLR